MTPCERLRQAWQEYRRRCPWGLSPDWLRCSRTQPYCILGGLSGRYRFDVPEDQKRELRALVDPEDEPNIPEPKEIKR